MQEFKEVKLAEQGKLKIKPAADLLKELKQLVKNPSLRKGF